MLSKRILLSALLLSAAFVALAMPAVAQPVAGIQVTVTAEDAMTFDVDADVTAYVTLSYPFSTLWLGFNTTGGGQVPAVEWGDGSFVSPYGYGGFTGIPVTNTSTVVSGQTVQIYRGSFSHTYADATPQTITANSFPSPNLPLITGTSTTYNGIPFVTNTAAVFTPVDGLPIPTTSDLGMVVLALLLAGAAVVLLRR